MQNVNFVLARYLDKFWSILTYNPKVSEQTALSSTLNTMPNSLTKTGFTEQKSSVVYSRNST